MVISRYEIRFTKNAEKDIGKLKAANLDIIAKKLIDVLRINPLQTPPPFEKLVGNLKGLYSRKLSH